EGDLRRDVTDHRRRAMVGLSNHLHRHVRDPRAFRASTAARPSLIMSRKPAAPLRTDGDRSCSPFRLVPQSPSEDGQSRCGPGSCPTLQCEGMSKIWQHSALALLMALIFVPSHVNETTDPVDNLGGGLTVVLI